MSSPEEVVREFCAAASKRDAALLRPMLADGVVYHNVGMAPSRGVDETIAAIEGFWAMFDTYCDFDVKHLAVSGNAVLTERVDTLGNADLPLPVPVMGIFEVDADGRISAWRDYFDMGLVGRMMAGEEVADVVP